MRFLLLACINPTKDVTCCVVRGTIWSAPIVKTPNEQFVECISEGDDDSLHLTGPWKGTIQLGGRVEKKWQTPSYSLIPHQFYKLKKCLFSFRR